MGRRWNPARFASSEVLLGHKRRVTCDAIMVITSADADQDRRGKCAIVAQRVKYLILHVSQIMATEERCHILGIIPVVSHEERNDLLCSIIHTLSTF